MRTCLFQWTREQKNWDQAGIFSSAHTVGAVLKIEYVGYQPV